MRLLFCFTVLFIALAGTQVRASSHYREELQDSEFEDFEEDETLEIISDIPSHLPLKENIVNIDDDDIIMVEDDNEFDHFQDDEEFEGYDNENPSKSDEKEIPKITITNVPLHLRTNWDSYYMELLMVAGLVAYFLNYFAGRAKNFKLANSWFTTHKALLEENFSVVGDDGKLENESPGLMKDSESQYSLWCSGRTCCEGMLVELRLLKRQDLVAVLANIMRPSEDQVYIRVDMNKEEMDSFVFCVGVKKTAVKLAKDMADLSAYCPERKLGDKYGLPSSFNVMSEMAEVASSMLDSKITTTLNKYAELIDYIHVSDQYSGPKQTEENPQVKLPEVKKVLIFSLNISLKSQPMQEAVESMRPLINLVFYVMEKVKRFRLSKEAKAKAVKNRLRVEEIFLKTTHAARAEAAAAKRENKRKEEKERILKEEDPEKQRRWEEKEMKRQMKKKAPKMKQLKVKAL